MRKTKITTKRIMIAIIAFTLLNFYLLFVLEKRINDVREENIGFKRQMAKELAVFLNKYTEEMARVIRETVGNISEPEFKVE